ncbi:hypothetical protein Tco_0024028 [Tanacetum coccineum]
MYYQTKKKKRQGKKISNGNDIAGYDKSKVSVTTVISRTLCRECRVSKKAKEDHSEIKTTTRKARNKEYTSKAMLAIDGVGKRVSEGEPKKVWENNDAPIIEDWVSDDEEQDESITKPVKKTVIPTATKIEKPIRNLVRFSDGSVVCAASVDRYRTTHIIEVMGTKVATVFQFLSIEALFEGRGRDTKIPQSSGPPGKKGWYEVVCLRCKIPYGGCECSKLVCEITSIQSIDPPLSRGYTLGSGVDINPMIYTSCIEQFWATAKVQTVNGVRQIQALVDKKRVIVTESSIRRDLHLDDAEGTDCLPTATIFEELARMGAKSTAWNEFSSSMASLIICLATNQKFNLSKYIFDAMVKHLDGGVKFLLYPRFLQVFINQQLGNMSTHKKIFVNPFHTKKVFANMKRAGKDFSGRITPLFDTMMVQPVEEMGEDSDHPTDSTPIPIIDQPSSSSQPKKDKPSKKVQRQEAEVPQDEAELISPPPPPAPHRRGVSTPLMIHKLVAKDAQAKEIVALKKRIQSFLVEKTQERQDDDLIFDTRVLDDVEMPVEAKVDGKDEQSTKKLDDSTTGEAVTTAGDDSVVPTTNEEITLAQTLIQIKAAKPKVVTTAATTATTTRPKDKGVVVQEPSEFRVTQEIKPSSSKDKGKGIMIEPEVPLKRKDQIALDEQIARDIQAKLDAELLEEQKLARKQEEEANIALIESWENTQAMMEADRLLAERLQSKEREELTNEEKAKLFMELMEKRRKHFAALRAQEKRNKPPTKAQKRTQMSTYLKHMEDAWKEKSRERTTERILKETKVKEEKESEEVELKKLLVIKKDEDIAIDAIPLATKLPAIIDYKLHKEEILEHYQLIRADGSSKRYSSMIRMLQGIDREDLEALWRIVKAKYGDTRPENEFERVLYGDLKVIFEPDIKSNVWRMLQGYRVTIWKLIDSSGVHFVRNFKTDYQTEMCNSTDGLCKAAEKENERGGLLGLKRLHEFLEVTAAQCCWWKDYNCLKTFYCQEDKDTLKR